MDGFEQQPRRGVILPGPAGAWAMLDKLSPVARRAVFWAMGIAGLALATLACFGAGLDFSTAAFAFLVVVVLFSLVASFVSACLFSVIAVVVLNYFFVPPLFTLEIGSLEDVTTLAAFIVTSLVVTSLIGRARTLAEAQREQARLLDLTTDAILVRDTDDVVTYWNRGAEALYGWSREEALGKVTHELLKTAFPAPLGEIRETLQRTGRWDGELVHTTRAGERVFVASRWSAQHDARGLAIGTLESNTDITERKRAEEELERSRAAYIAEAQRLSRTGSFGWDVSNDQLIWSDETFRIFGYEPSTTPSAEMAMQRVHPDDAGVVREAVRRTVDVRQNLDFEYRLLMPGGEVKHVHMVVRPATADGRQFIGAVSDITDRVRARETLDGLQADLARAMRVSVLGELTASIAHEINQPLAAIYANGQTGLRWLARPEPDLAEVREATESIVADARRAADIIARIRTMAAKQSPARTVMPFHDVVGEAVLFLNRELQARAVAVSYAPPDVAVPVLGDRTQLQQVVVNLVVNSMQALAQANSARRRIAIRTALSAGSSVTCTVEDSGPGIAPEHMGRLFESFFTTKEGGMGMGLPICRSIVEAHGGRITADNDSSEGGARFIITLPVAASAS